MNSRPSRLDYVRRAADMPLREVLTRSRQLMWKLGGRFGLGAPIGHIPDSIARRPLTPALCDFDHTAEVARRIDREAANRIVAQADAACEGRFSILGFGLLNFGDPVDWHWDPVYGRRSPKIHFSRIDPLDVGLVGDHKIVWELNRHAFLPLLAQAYGLTGEQRYLARAAGLLGDWLDHNPREVGINWVSSLEVAFRAITWAYVWPVLTCSPHCGPALRAAWLASIVAHARHVARFTSHYFAPNTHLTGEALALYLLGLTFPELTGARRYLRLARRILDNELGQQLRADGFHYEQSACYHRYTLEFLLLDYLATALLAFEPAADAHNRLERAADAALSLLQPDGTLVNIGDEDGGRLLPLGVRDPLDARPLLAACALVLRRPDLKAIVGALPAETIWVLGPEAEDQWEALPTVSPQKASQILPNAGYVAMRDAWGSSADYLLFDSGPHGAARCRYGHAHADALGVVLTTGSRSFIVDPGTGTYVDPVRRDSLRSTFSHSTAWVDDKPHCTPGRSFEWLTAAHGSLRQWRSTAEFDLAEGVHDGYRGARDPVAHSRRVLYWKRRGWLLRDLFEAKGTHRISVQFVLAAEPAVVAVQDCTVSTPSGALCVLPTLDAHVLECSVSPIDISRRYGSCTTGSAFRVVVEARLPAVVVTLLRASGPPPSLRLLDPGPSAHSASVGTDCALLDTATGDSVLLRDFEAGPATGSAGTFSDAAVTWISGSGEILVVGGSNVVVRHNRVLQSEEAGDWLIEHGTARQLLTAECFSA